MSVKQIWQWKNLDGQEVIDFASWAENLPQEQAEEYKASVERQVQLRQEAIDRGDMHIDPDTGFYVWKDMPAARKGKENDLIWERYWRLYVAEINLDTKNFIEFIEE